MNDKRKQARVIALVGQPNCGKSTLFNAVAGYRALAGNCPGTTAEITSSRVRIEGEAFELVDLPGVYSLAGSEPVERAALRWLIDNPAALVINIIDASTLGRSLELTLELMELERPMVLCLNMLDEAKRKGIEIDIEKLSQILKLPVVGTIASKGEGIDQLFAQARKALLNPSAAQPVGFSDDVEKIVASLKSSLLGKLESAGLPMRFFLLKLMEADPEVLERLNRLAPEKQEQVSRHQQMLQEHHGRESGEVICSERHALALNIFEKVARVRPRQPVSLGEKIDFWLMHKYLGYLFMVLVLFLLFAFVFWTGKFIETPLIGLFDQMQKFLSARLGQNPVAAIVIGLIQGFAGGIGIVLPYLVPFLLGLGLIEDIGYLPRIAFLMDSFMHRIGLHGKAVIPFMLGYGCNVPALMAVRTLESPRDRLITAILTTMIPCSARTTIIFGLAAYLLGPVWALVIYLLNILVIALIGRAMIHFLPEPSEGLIMEVPTYKMPNAKILVKKIWFRLREFIVVAWPILIAGSVVLSLMEFYKLDYIFNRGLSPLVVHLLGLPEKIGVTLIFGILRKELTLVMLTQALGTVNFLSILTPIQIIVFVVFVVFYIPCLSTLAVLWRILGWKGMLGAAGLTLAVATFLGLMFRLALTAVGYS